MNVRLEDGTIRCASHMDASDYVSQTIEKCTYCTPEEDTELLYQAAQAIIDAVVIETEEAPKAPAKKVRISPRYGFEGYSMRGAPGRKGDKVQRHIRKINGTSYEFSQIDWATGGREIKVYLAGTTTLIHHF